jgi:hypothetical protein
MFIKIFHYFFLLNCYLLYTLLLKKFNIFYFNYILKFLSLFYKYTHYFLNIKIITGYISKQKCENSPKYKITYKDIIEIKKNYIKMVYHM